jgi:hypothetical protein
MSALWLGWAGAAALPLGRPLIGRRRSATVVTRPA